MHSNMWKHVKLICGNEHTERREMYIKKTDVDAFYACPMFAYGNEESRVCMNRLSVKDYENMLEYISNILIEAESNNEIANLKGLVFHTRNIEYKIVEHKGEDMVVQVLNRRAVFKPQ